MSKYEYKIIRYKYIVQDDPIVPNDLVQDKSVYITEEEYKILYTSMVSMIDAMSSKKYKAIKAMSNVCSKLREIMP